MTVPPDIIDYSGKIQINLYFMIHTYYIHAFLYYQPRSAPTMPHLIDPMPYAEIKFI